MKIRTFTLVAVAIMLVSLFTVTAMAADQQRDRDQDCTGVPDEALRTQTRTGFNAGDVATGEAGVSNGYCDGSNCEGNYDRECDGSGSQNDRDCDGDGPKRDGSCQI
ncbi:hypothetical protein [Methanolobus sp. ZRKC5]|uniref:hypothetical protein n=1 Tax=unclassified Methanolobus TaxID=2629569 RepID=UPI00313D8304